MKREGLVFDDQLDVVELAQVERGIPGLELGALVDDELPRARHVLPAGDGSRFWGSVAKVAVKHAAPVVRKAVDSVRKLIFQKPGAMTGKVITNPKTGVRTQEIKEGVFEIGVTRDGVVDHRFFRPNG